MRTSGDKGAFTLNGCFQGIVPRSVLGKSLGNGGAGVMGAGIAQVAAQAGHSVVVFDTNEPALARGRSLLDKNLQRLVERGKISAEDAAATAARLTWSPEVADLTPCGLVIEAIFENLKAKAALFAKVEAAVAPDAVPASNTSSLSITALAAHLARPTQFLGLHFFNPAR